MTNNHPQTGKRDLSAFAAALRNARTLAKTTQEDLAAALGDVAQSSVSSWERGVMEPPPEVTFRIERALGAKPGSVSQHLGYIPAHVRAILKQDVVDAILRDRSLGERERKAILNLYGTLSRQTESRPSRRRTTG